MNLHKPPFASNRDENTIVSSRPQEARHSDSPQPYLRIVHPRDKTSRFLITTDGLVVGRGPEADIFIPDAQVSRKHCTIRVGTRGVLVQDHSSTNGTSVDGQQIEHHYLSPASRLKIGSFVLRVEYRANAEINDEDHLQEAVRTDDLTGIRNRRWFFQQAAQVMRESVTSDVELSFVMIDVDHFKQVNDRHGHAAGDGVLKRVAQILNDEKRENDLLARFGGEEFVMLLPNTGSTEAMVFCDRLREKVEQSTFTYAAQFLNIQISIGISSKRAGEYQTLDAAVNLADAAMYRAKKSGRNRVSF